MAEKNLLFVYGTLRIVNKRGHPIDEETLNKIVLARKAYVSGFEMRHLGRFPGVTIGDPDHWIQGEIHRIGSIDQHDGYEGFDVNDPENSLYIREQVTCELPEGPDPNNPEVWNEPGQIHNVWLYVFNNARWLGTDAGCWADRHAPTIRGGDWFAEEGLYDDDPTESV